MRKLQYYRTSSDFTIFFNLPVSLNLDMGQFKPQTLALGPIEKDLKRNPLVVAQGEGKDLLTLGEWRKSPIFHFLFLFSIVSHSSPWQSAGTYQHSEGREPSFLIRGAAATAGRWSQQPGSCCPCPSVSSRSCSKGTTEQSPESPNFLARSLREPQKTGKYQGDGGRGGAKRSGVLKLCVISGAHLLSCAFMDPTLHNTAQPWGTELREKPMPRSTLAGGWCTRGDDPNSTGKALKTDHNPEGHLGGSVS